MSERTHQRPASFHATPAEAAKAPPEELLHVACLHEGHPVAEPDFIGGRRRVGPPPDADAERVRRAPARWSNFDTRSGLSTSLLTFRSPSARSLRSSIRASAAR